MISCKNSWEIKEFENDLITQLIKNMIMMMIIEI